MAQAFLVKPAARQLILPRRGFRKPARPVLDPNDPINRGLSACWLLGESGNGLYRELSPNNLTGTGVNAPTVTPSHHGGLSTTFNGSNNYVTIADNSALNIGASDRFSFCAWIYLTSTGSAANRIFSKTSTGSPEVGINIDATSGAGALQW